MKSTRYVRTAAPPEPPGPETLPRPAEPRPLEEVLPELRGWLERLAREEPENAAAYRVFSRVFEVQARIEREALERLRGQEEYLASLARRAPREGKTVIELAGGLPEELLDDAWLREKLLELISAARDAGMELEARAAPLEAPVEKMLISPSEMLIELLAGREDTVNAWAGAVSAPRETIRSLAAWLLQPLLSAVKLASARGLRWAAEIWQRGRCPVCGAPASIGYMVGEGRHQFMKCSVCGMEWRFPRATCPACGASEPGAVVFYQPLREKAPWLRIYRCKKCGWTWSIIDEEDEALIRSGKPPRELYPLIAYPVEAETLKLLEKRSAER